MASHVEQHDGRCLGVLGGEHQHGVVRGGGAGADDSRDLRGHGRLDDGLVMGDPLTDLAAEYQQHDVARGEHGRVDGGEVQPLRAYAASRLVGEGVGVARAAR